MEGLRRTGNYGGLSLGTETARGRPAAVEREREAFRELHAAHPAGKRRSVVEALNQARLVIAAKYNFTDGELVRSLPLPIGSRRDLGLFR